MRPHGSIKNRIEAMLVLALVVLAGVALLQSMIAARAAWTWNVEMYGDDMNSIYQFIPQNITFSVGDTINWTDVSGQHSTTANPGQGEWWDSGVLDPGESYTFTFTVPGVYTYWSAFPMDIDMVGEVTVQQPTPEFPGSLITVVLAMAVLLGLLMNRKLRV